MNLIKQKEESVLTFTEAEENMIYHVGETQIEKKRRRNNLIALIVVSVVLLCSLLTMFYMLAPLKMKVVGSWENTNNPNLTIDIDDKYVTFRSKDIQGLDGYTTLIEGKLFSAGINQYKASDVKAYMLIDRNKITETEYKSIIANNDAYKVVKDNDKELKIEYTDQSVKEMYYETNGIDHFFNLKTDEMNKLKSLKLFLKNQHIAKDSIEFRRKK